MQFPKRELEIVRLAQDASRGLAANPDVFPAPPTTAAALEEALTAYNAAREASVAGLAAAQAGTTAKQQAVDSMVTMLQATVKYAEFVAKAKGDGGVLKKIGWGGRRRPVRNEREAPGQVITLNVNQEGKDWVTLAWNEPFDGGTVAAYRIQRRRRETGEWMDVATTVETAVRLHGQEAGIELEYQIIGINQAGEGPTSNIVRVVL